MISQLCGKLSVMAEGSSSGPPNFHFCTSEDKTYLGLRQRTLRNGFIFCLLWKLHSLLFIHDIYDCSLMFHSVQSYISEIIFVILFLLQGLALGGRSKMFLQSLFSIYLGWFSQLSSCLQVSCSVHQSISLVHYHHLCYHHHHHHNLLLFHV